MIGAYKYVVLAFVALVAFAGAGYTGWHQRGRIADAEISAIKADLSEKVAQAEKRAAETSERVVIRYKDRIQIVKQVSPEVERDVQVIAKSDCVLPSSFVRLHDAGAGVPSQAPAGVDDPAAIPCSVAIETIRANYAAARENAEQLAALQEWARGVSEP